MIKWLGRIVFVIIVGLLTVQIYYFAYYSKLQEFYAEHMAQNVDDDDLYLRGMNALSDIDYYQDMPIYRYQSENPDYLFNFSVRAIGAQIANDKKDRIRVDGLMFYMNNIRIKDYEHPVIRITLTLDQASIIVRDEKGKDSLIDSIEMVYNSGASFPESNIPVLFLLKTEGSMIIPETTTLANVSMIKLEYSSGVPTPDGKSFDYDPKALFIASVSPVSEGAYMKDESFFISEESYSLSHLFVDNIPTQDDIISFGLITERESLSAYNGIVWRTMIGYTLIVALVSYMLFFHKKVMENYKAKRDAKFRAENPRFTKPKEIIEELKDEEKDGL